MNEIEKTKWSDQTKFRLDKISKIENLFNSEIDHRKLCSKKLSKYVSAFDYTDKILIVLNATTGGVCIVSHATVVGAPVGIARCWIYYCIFFSNRNEKKILKTTKNKIKSIIKFLCWLKVNSIASKL